MKNPFLFIIINILIILSCDKNEDEEISYISYEDYFVKTLYQTNANGTYLILNDTSDLNSVFTQITSIENPNWIKPDDFNSKIGIAITKDLPTCTCPEMLINHIYLKDQKIDFNYILPEYDSDNIHLCDVICRLLLLVMVKRDLFTSIDFYENGHKVLSINDY